MIRTLLLGAMAASLAGSARAGETLTVSAASSLRESIRAVARAFEAHEPGMRVRINLGASNLLARQIEAGAPADVFISADRRTMDRLAEEELIEPAGRYDLLGNRLVAVAPGDSDFRPEIEADLASERLRRIAIGERAVPAGYYADRYMEKIGLTGALKGRIVRTESVRATLAAVQSGHADLGWVYATDARVSRRVRVVWEAPIGAHPPIVYPVAAIAGSRARAVAGRFLDFLKSRESREIFTKAGFEFLVESTR